MADTFVSSSENDYDEDIALCGHCSAYLFRDAYKDEEEKMIMCRYCQQWYCGLCSKDLDIPDSNIDCSLTPRYMWWDDSAPFCPRCFSN